MMKSFPVKICAVVLAFFLIGLSQGFAYQSLPSLLEKPDVETAKKNTEVKEPVNYIFSVEAELNQGNEEVTIFEDDDHFQSSFLSPHFYTPNLLNTPQEFHNKSSNISLFILDCALIL